MKLPGSPDHVFRRRVSRCGGFSLVEILTVSALIALMATLAAPAVSAVMNADRVTSALSGIASLLEQARSYAMAQNTAVYVGFVEVNPEATNSSNPGTGKVVMAAFALRGGGSSFSSQDELVPIGRPVQFPGVTLDGALPRSGNLTRDVADVQAGGSDFGVLPAQLASGSWRFTQALRFDPQGSVWKSAGSDVHGLFEIGLRPARGQIRDTSSPNVAALQIDALTGSVRLFRP